MLFSQNHHRSCLVPGLVFAGFFLACAPVQALAQLSQWTGATSNNWFEPSNWDPVGVPGAGANVLLDTQVTNTTLVDGATTATLGAIQVGVSDSAELEVINGGTLVNDGIAFLGSDAGSFGAVFVEGAGSSWTINHNLVVGQSGAGILNVLSGATLSNNHSRIGNEATGAGGVTLDGSGWTVNGNLWVGHTGTGLLNVRGGSSMTTSAQPYIGYETGAAGTMRVREGSGWTATGADALMVGRRGEGTLLIESGSGVEVPGIAVGVFDGGQGSVSLDGGSLTVAGGGDFSVGLNGQGEVDILDGSFLGNAIGTLGTFPTGAGRVTVSGPTASWSSTGSLSVGFQGDGELLIEAGGTVSNSGAGMGVQDGSLGEALVTGAGSSWNLATSLHVGTDGTGSLEIAGGGQVNSQISRIGFGPTGSGTVTLVDSGSVWNVTGSLSVGHEGSGVLELGAGAVLNASDNFVVASQPGSQGLMRLDNGTVNVMNGLVVNAPGVIRGPGTINGNVRIEDGATLEPTLNPGSPGTISVNGNLTLESAANLEIELGIPGVAGGGVNSLIEVDGDLTLDGILNIDDGGGFGDGVYTLFTYTGTLTDNGLVFNDVPVGPLLNIDTSVAGEVRLVVGATGPFTWLGGDSEDWFTPGNWDPAAVPGVGDMVNLDNVVPNPTIIDGLVNANTGTLRVGADNQGELIIRNEAILTSTASSIAGFFGSTGSALVTFPGSRWDSSVVLTVGANGPGSLRVEDGGVVTAPTSSVGTNTGSAGVATVSGPDSQWVISGELLVGRFGSGSVRIEDGALLESENVAIGFGAGSSGQVTVDGGGSRWNNDDEMIVGEEGVSAALTILNGGRVDNRGSAAIGLEAGFGGEVVLEGAGSVLNNDGSLYVGWAGEGLLDIGADTDVAVGGSTTVAAAPGSSGELRVNGTLSSGLGVIVLDGGVLRGGGSVAASVQIAGGQVAPGASPGTLQINGGLELDDESTLVFELDTPGVAGGGVNDLISVAGDLVLDGQLEVEDLGGFSEGNYTLITYTGTLTDNGMTIASLPAGFDGTIDATIAGEIQLVVEAGEVLDPAELAADPPAQDFGEIELGEESGVRSFVLRNIGGSELVLGSLVITGGNPDDFQLLVDSCSAQVLDADEECEVQVVFQPLALDLRVASLEAPWTSPPGTGGTVEIALSGVGVAPGVAPVPIPTMSRIGLAVKASLLLLLVWWVAMRRTGIPDERWV